MNISRPRSAPPVDSATNDHAPTEKEGDLFRAAYAAHRAGRTDEAEAGYRRVIAADGRHADALHLLGLLLTRKGEPGEAEALLRRALAIREHPAFLGNLGILLRQAGRPAEAEAAYRRALALKPDYAEARLNLGNLLKENGRPGEAEAAYRHALELAPEHAGAWVALGTLLQKGGRLAEAGEAYRRALELDPDQAPVHNNLALLHVQEGRPAEAEAACRQAIGLDPSFAEAHNNLGNLLREGGRAGEAETFLRRALELRPEYSEARLNLGLLLLEAKRMAEAEAVFRRVLEALPDSVEAHNNLGLLLLRSRRLEEAEAAFRRALSAQPDNTVALNNFGQLLRQLGRHAEAEAVYHRALALRPDHASARLNLALLLLALGRYPEAWPCYESRYGPPLAEVPLKLPELPFPRWRGEPLAGKSLLIWPEQGFGDAIQFARYLPLLKGMGVDRLTLLCPPPLRDLLATAAGVDAVVTDAAAIPAHDYWSFPLSLPLHLGTRLDNLPAELPYLRPPPERLEHWRERLPAGGRRVGLVWKGSAGHTNDASRSLPGLAALAPLWSVPGVSFVSLQKGQGEEEAERPPPGQPIVPLGGELRDFADTAAVVDLLDLVLCVDTSVAHVAGALGKPCWVLLPAFNPDWRWLLDRTDSPWYPGVMRLFRQPALDDWEGTIAEVADALRAWADGKGQAG